MSTAAISYRSLRSAAGEARDVAKKLDSYASSLNRSVYNKLGQYDGSWNSNVRNASSSLSSKVRELEGEADRYRRYAEELEEARDECRRVDKNVGKEISRLTSDFKKANGIRDSRIANAVYYTCTQWSNSSFIGRWINDRVGDGANVIRELDNEIRKWYNRITEPGGRKKWTDILQDYAAFFLIGTVSLCLGPAHQLFGLLQGAGLIPDPRENCDPLKGYRCGELSIRNRLHENPGYPLHTGKTRGFGDAFISAVVGGVASTLFPYEPVKPAESTAQKASKLLSGVSDDQYAGLCALAYEVDQGKMTAEELAKELRSSDDYPEGHFLKNVSADEIRYIGSPTGFAAVVIGSGDDAVIIFVGTDPTQVNDYVADATLVLTNTSTQSAEAHWMVQEVSKEYANVVVTGHSLGGYLATEVTLNNPSIKKCVAFDPPGRMDAMAHNLLNKNAKKVTTYEANGSPISAVHHGVGKVHRIRVNGKDNFLRHSISEIQKAIARKGRSGGGSR